MKLQESAELVEAGKFSVDIFGLGYVGFPLAVRLSSGGVRVNGIDTNPGRIQRLSEGELVDTELPMAKKFEEVMGSGKLGLHAAPGRSSDPKVGMICVPTPLPGWGSDSAVHVKAAAESFLSVSRRGDVLILESSVEVGTTEMVRNMIESRGHKVGEDYGLCFCPERVDPANKEWGMEGIPRVIYSSDDYTHRIALQVYGHVNGGVLSRVGSPRTAEVVKSFENAFRLVNISLVNELAMLCDRLGISARDVIDAASTKPFGFIPHYPGAGAGGHCIPKDPRFLLESARGLGSAHSMIDGALEVNGGMPAYVADRIGSALDELGLDGRIIVCGLAYKANVEDMRDSPGFKVADELSRRGFTVQGYDPFFNVGLAAKYLAENRGRADWAAIETLDARTVKGTDCLCIVQHHEAAAPRISEIYLKSEVPFIYDCQSILAPNSASSTRLVRLGG
ncbi:UDP-N-acetyl-D-mannosaminuronate dehydrogenase [Cenarchaeum symbiosum A]|uniref:UDP-N-acetyl-D-mannosamine dehydrogenase n=1 Tax=Cenarchaeum symbiosum (strain A) TaxID=414004 RepID=A0RWA8_CENSY|nr:UDP-N-acetyl-D-mannosaminuronate dehydrogenase [Cenarchaeum symbiosum A]